MIRPQLSRLILSISVQERMTKDGLTKAIGIHKQTLTPSASKHLQDTARNFQIHMFQEQELVINVTKHVLVPKHELLSSKEKEAILQK